MILRWRCDHSSLLLGVAILTGQLRIAIKVNDIYDLYHYWTCIIIHNTNIITQYQYMKVITS